MHYLHIEYHQLTLLTFTHFNYYRLKIEPTFKYEKDDKNDRHNLCIEEKLRIRKKLLT